MTTTSIDIQPFAVSKISQRIEMLIPYELNSATGQAFVYLKDDVGNTLKVETVNFTEFEWANWTTSDDYIIDLTLTKLGLVPILPE